MVRRLVLGCGTVGHAVVSGLAGRSGDLTVVAGDPDRAETLRGESVTAEAADPTDPAVLRDIDGAVDVALVLGDDPGDNHAAAAAASEVFPEAYLLAYTGVDPPAPVAEALSGLADTVVDYGGAVAEALGRGDAAEDGRTEGLQRTLRRIDGRLGVVTHDNPDPDAIGSAVALRELARDVGVEAEVGYFGEIAHQENRALVNLLDISLVALDPEAFDPGTYDAIALIDHARPGVNDRLPPDTPVEIVIDHHPPRDTVDATFIDLRSDVGATSTLLAGYYRGLGRDVPEQVATALLYGIRVDTRDFGREITEADFEAAAFLLPFADTDVLERVENPSVAGETVDVLGRAIRNRERRDDVLVSGAGRIGNRDALAQAADRLLAMEGVRTSLVHGYRDGTIFVSARTADPDIDLGEAMRRAYDRIGSAGGHTDMAGAQIPLGILGTAEDETELAGIVFEVVANRFFEVVRPGAPPVDPSG
ncbi:MAG: DHH family phosphoesterase [Halobacteriales archaeon]